MMIKIGYGGVVKEENKKPEPTFEKDGYTAEKMDHVGDECKFDFELPKYPARGRNERDRR
jgi:hypothetical protein